MLNSVPVLIRLMGSKERAVAHEVYHRSRTTRKGSAYRIPTCWPQ